MPDEYTPKTDKHTTAESIANTFEWLITAFVLAFVFRAFVLEAFQIPTGSMAETLMGQHFQICCPQCGYSYEYNFDPYTQQKCRVPTAANLYQMKYPPRCPSCGYYAQNTFVPKSNGDRILVFKCLYQFAEPKRWDVIVFKNPPEPKINYIKRLLGKPGETIEIIDGDIYIDNVLARKPQKVQQEMWMCVYNNDYKPVHPIENSFNKHIWLQPFTNEADSQWVYDSAKPTQFSLKSNPEELNTMYYDTKKGNDFRSTYAYGNPLYYHNMPICSDLMMNYHAKFGTDKGSIGIGLGKYDSLYKASLNPSGIMIIEKLNLLGQSTELCRKEITPPAQDKTFLVRFANVDHQLIFEIDDQKLTYDLGTGKNDAGDRLGEIEPRALFFGSGDVTISHIALYRDTHYLGTRPESQEPVYRAGEGNPFTLEKDEFFALGDNSPASLDSRLWDDPGVGNNGQSYRIGVVPRDYLVGKAFFVYWPSSFKTGKSRLGFVPNIGRMRFIYGGID
ncbi:MAG: signal peptidase I [Sedimentisphaerales bacterium]|nr:signal peptidase I [Sedimentisphaerales bacterium]